VIETVCGRTAQTFSDERFSQEAWYALYTKSRHEKLLYRELSKKGIEAFLPLRKVTRHWSDRKQIVEEPVFQGYLFVRMPWVSRIQVLQTAGAVRFVTFSAANPVSVPDKEIESLKRFIDHDIPIDPYPYLKKGQRVYIRTGPFKGAEGFIVYKNQHCRLVISLDLLMQSVSVEIDEACVEPV
jgi:transcription termination/antitermination protein NusG